MILRSKRKGNDCIWKLLCHCIQILHSEIYSVCYYFKNVDFTSAKSLHKPLFIFNKFTTLLEHRCYFHYGNVAPAMFTFSLDNTKRKIVLTRNCHHGICSCTCLWAVFVRNTVFHCVTVYICSVGTYTFVLFSMQITQACICNQVFVPIRPSYQ